MAFKPVLLKASNVVLGDPASGVDFACQVKTCKLTQSASEERWGGLCPEGEYVDVAPAQWALELGTVLGTADAGEEVLVEWLKANHGTTVPYLVRPIAGGKGYSGTLVVKATDIGGDKGSFAETSVTLPVNGEPTPVAAV